LGLLYNLILGFIGLLTVGLHEASGEVFPRFFAEGVGRGIWGDVGKPLHRMGAWFRPSSRREQLMALIITDRGKEVADRILQDMNRGVTAITGKGMYTGETRNVLMCALTVTEVGKMKHLVSDVDSQAFVIVSPVREILGRGFQPLEERQ
jgi:hypothetical protein